MKSAKKYLLIIGSIIVVTYLFFQVAFTTYTMPNRTMEATIKKGEQIYINKLAFGSYIFGFKLPGLSEIKTGDLVYMIDPSQEDKPLYDRDRIIVRVAARPHDFFSIKTRNIVVNNKTLDDVPSIQHGHRIVAREGVNLDSSFFLKYNLTEYINETDKTKMHQKYKEIYQFTDESPLEIWEAPMTREKAAEVEKDSLISYVQFVQSRVPGRVVKIWPYSQYWFWNRWNTSPDFQVPGKGLSIPMNYRTLRAYEKIVTAYENNQLNTNANFEVYINGNQANNYTVQENYYIVLSDNRDRFYDTRTWGLVPEKYIIGKVINK